MLATHSTQQALHHQVISVTLGNRVQAIGFCAGAALLLAQAQPGFIILPNIGFLMAYLVVAFTSYASAQYIIGRILGIRFSHYTISASGTGFFHLSAQPDPRSWSKQPRLARGAFALSGATTSCLISLGVAALALNAGLWMGIVIVAANVLWLVYTLAHQAVTCAERPQTAPRRSRKSS
ncbi:MAG: hypothetical protein HC853_09755 [Anaerolineae bacterium]|nr:hypothetical protein [Anaerolineae bacterium]